MVVKGHMWPYDHILGVTSTSKKKWPRYREKTIFYDFLGNFEWEFLLISSWTCPTAIFERAKKASPIGLAFLYDFVRFLTGVDNMQFFSGLEWDKRFWFFQRCAWQCPTVQQMVHKQCSYLVSIVEAIMYFNFTARNLSFAC